MERCIQMKDGDMLIPANDIIFSTSYYLSNVNTSQHVYIPYYSLNALVNVYNLVDYRNETFISPDGVITTRLL